MSWPLEEKDFDTQSSTKLGGREHCLHIRSRKCARQENEMSPHLVPVEVL